MKKYHDVAELKFEGDTLVITVDGRVHRYPLETVSPALKKVSQNERYAFELSPSGYGIYWPQLDEDISIDGLLGIVHVPEEKRKVA